MNSWGIKLYQPLEFKIQNLLEELIESSLKTYRKLTVITQWKHSRNNKDSSQSYINIPQHPPSSSSVTTISASPQLIACTNFYLSSAGYTSSRPNVLWSWNNKNVLAIEMQYGRTAFSLHSLQAAQGILLIGLSILRSTADHWSNHIRVHFLVIIVNSHSIQVLFSAHQNLATDIPNHFSCHECHFVL